MAFHRINQLLIELYFYKKNGDWISVFEYGHLLICFERIFSVILVVM